MQWNRLKGLQSVDHRDSWSMLGLWWCFVSPESLYMNAPGIKSHKQSTLRNLKHCKINHWTLDNSTDSGYFYILFEFVHLACDTVDVTSHLFIS